MFIDYLKEKNTTPTLKNVDAMGIENCNKE